MDKRLLTLQSYHLTHSSGMHLPYEHDPCGLAVGIHLVCWSTLTPILQAQ